MNKYPPAVIEKAKNQEKLLQARAADKTLAQARAIAGIAVTLVFPNWVTKKEDRIGIF